MPRRVLVQRPGEAFDLVEIAAPSEHNLQELIKANPQLLPSDDLGLDGELLVVGRETTLASGSIDLLCLARSGELVLIEFKTGPQNPDFRHALAQVVDYGSDLWGLSLEGFDKGVVQRYLKGPHCAQRYRGASDLSDAISLSDWALTADHQAALEARLADVLRTGDFIYVVAAQRFAPPMITSLKYLNATMRYGRFFLVEVVRLEGQELTAHAAQVVSGPSAKVAGSSLAATSQANQSDFLHSVADVLYREALEELFSACTALGLVVYWGSVGASIRIKTPDRNEPLSVGWVFPEGGQWYGARHVTLGVDETSVATTPSLDAQVESYVHAVAQIDGAKRVASKLNGYTFEPAIVPKVMTKIIRALESLVEETQA